jgi:hypothetical protein
MAIRQRLGLNAEASAGFFDTTSIQLSVDFENSIIEALLTCRALVCMYSPAYFASEYCGKEVEIFLTRLEKYVLALSAGTNWPPLVMPVLLYPPYELPAIPPVLAGIQYTDDDYPQAYREEGLLYLMKRNSQQEAYSDFLDAFARKLIFVTKTYLLPPAEESPSLSEVESAFHKEIPETSTRGGSIQESSVSAQRSEESKETIVAEVRQSKDVSPDVFLSYASSDRDRIRFIVEALEREGFSVWWDRNIRVGKSFSRIIKAKIDSAKCVVVVWSKTSVFSTWVEAEASRASKQEKIVPVLIDDVLEDVPLEFSLIQAAHLTESSESLIQSEMKSLVESVREFLS